LKYCDSTIYIIKIVKFKKNMRLVKGCLKSVMQRKVRDPVASFGPHDRVSRSPLIKPLNFVVIFISVNVPLFNLAPFQSISNFSFASLNYFSCPFNWYCTGYVGIQFS